MAQSNYNYFSLNCLPNSLPPMKSGKLNCKVRLRTDYNKIGTERSVILQLSLNRVIKRISLGFNIDEKDFDNNNQRVKAKNKNSRDYNLLIEKKLADINTVEVSYRLSGRILNFEALFEELNNPTAKIDFITFWDKEMIRQKEILKESTYRQQMSVLNKVKAFKSPLYFYEITEDYVSDLKAHYKRKKKNKDNTIASMVKSFKKYLHIANKKGIPTPINFSEIKNKSFKGNRTFLDAGEIKKLYEYWQSPYVNETYKNILSRFLFSCFTGLRFSDTLNIKEENIIENTLVFTAEKTGKFQRIKLNNTAKKLIDPIKIFNEPYTNEYTNRELKNIAKAVGIRKKITFHVSRHSFATNFIICGGRIENLQKLLGHSKIEETMIYLHIVEQITDTQILKMDAIFD
jgi:site-specific recombinase XerD